MSVNELSLRTFNVAPSFGGASRFAAVVPVGPNAVDLWRAVALVESLLYWEPELGWCVFVDDSSRARPLDRLVVAPTACRVVALPNPRRGRGDGHLGGLCTGLLTALHWIWSETPADFILKIDTDALVIAPFAATIRSRLRDLPDAGLLGVVGDSCNPARGLRRRLHVESSLAKAHRLLADVASPESLPADDIERRGLPRPSFSHLRAFGLIRSHIADAVRNGYSWDEFCQGGAYVINRSVLARMVAAGYFDRANAWMHLLAFEDRVMGMYVRAVGLTVRDCCSDGEPFGVQFSGLPYAPDELVARGYSIIHSVKNDRRYSEQSIRAFFRNRVVGSRN